MTTLNKLHLHQHSPYILLQVFEVALNYMEMTEVAALPKLPGRDFVPAERR